MIKPYRHVIIAPLLMLSQTTSAGPIEDCNQIRNLVRQFQGCNAYINQVSGSREGLATAHLNLAIIYARQGKFTLALSSFSAAASFDPGNPLIPYNRANMYLDSLEYRRAVADFTIAIELDEDFAIAYANRAIAFERLGQAPAAADDYRRALNLDPSLQQSRNGLERMRVR